MTTEDKRLAAAWFDAITRMCDVTPKGWRAAHGDALALVSGGVIPALNVAASTTPDPGLASRNALDEAAAHVAGTGLPWSILVRGDASEPVAALAARHGLTERSDQLLMGCAAADAVLPAGPVGSTLIRPIGAAENKVYTGILAEGFGVPVHVFESLMGGDVLDAPGITGYLGETDGHLTATGMGVQGDGAVGVFNISVVGSARSRGLGRAMTARVMADGFAAGADAAYLTPSQEGLPLYRSMGFRVIETWTTFSAGAGGPR